MTAWPKACDVFEPTATPNQLPVPDTGFEFLSRAIGEMMDSAERGVAEAAMRARELEVQLEVATAERQHAEAILLHHFRWVVLVTDHV